ncbi:MAG: UDP-3-O-(3-hydroxymyristoyl)glucosamine N-acyltransferase [Gammaproteobacteria bacterium]
MTSMKVADIARRLGAAVHRGAGREISGLASLRDAVAGDLTFATHKRYAALAKTTAATAIIVSMDWDQPCPAAMIHTDNPQAAFQEVASWFAPPPVDFEPGIHPTAIIADDAALGAYVHIGPYCVIEPKATIGERTTMVANCYVGYRTTLGENCRLYPHVVVREDVRIGDRATLHSGAVIGADGFGFTVEDGKGVKVPQLGTVWIGDDVEVGANTTIDRARFSATHIGDGVKIDNLVQIGHNAVIEDHVGIISQVGVSGSCRVGGGAMLYGQAGIAGHVEIGAKAMVGAQAGVINDVPPGAYVSGYPATDHGQAMRLQAHLRRLPDLDKKVQKLHARIAALEEKLAGGD